LSLFSEASPLQEYSAVIIEQKYIRKMLNLRLGYLFSTIHSKICIVGGGSAGLNISAHLLKTFPASEMRIFEPNPIHYYQPAFTMIGGDIASSRDAIGEARDVLPKDIPLTP
jgi:hypothetical protein